MSSNSYRKLIYKHILPNSWGALGIDICLGAIIDKNVSLEDELFLPYNLKSYFDKLGNTNIKNGELISTSIIYGKYSDYKENSFPPVYVILILSLIIILTTFFDYLRIDSTNILDIILLLITGIIGLLLIYLWFFSNHIASTWNYNLLWAMPFNLFLAYELLKKNKHRWILPYLIFYVISFEHMV